MFSKNFLYWTFSLKIWVCVKGKNNHQQMKKVIAQSEFTEKIKPFCEICGLWFFIFTKKQTYFSANFNISYADCKWRCRHDWLLQICWPSAPSPANTWCVNAQEIRGGGAGLWLRQGKAANQKIFEMKKVKWTVRHI